MVYVCTANAISLLTQALINIKPVKKALGIPIPTEYEEQLMKEAQRKQKDFVAGFKESWTNQKMLAELKEREKLMERKFKQAGTTAPPRTFKENPKLKK